MFQTAETSQVVMVPILGDNTLERVEQFTVRLFLPTGQRGVVLGSDTATVEITDDDCKLFTYPMILYRRYHNHLCILFSAVTVEFDPASYTVSESGRFANITVVKRGQTTLPVSVDFITTDSSAIG